MNYTNVFTKTLFLLIVMSMCVLLYSNNTAAFSKKGINFDRMEPVEINAVVSEINLKEGYLIVGEKKIFLIEFKVGSKHYMTSFVNERGNTSYINSLKATLWKGERVLVRGFKLDNGDILAGVIKKISSGNK
jgi:hypothetical protein